VWQKVTNEHGVNVETLKSKSTTKSLFSTQKQKNLISKGQYLVENSLLTMCPTNPRWQTAAILKKMINCYTSATTGMILMKIDTVMHIASSNPTSY